MCKLSVTSIKGGNDQLQPAEDWVRDKRAHLRYIRAVMYGPRHGVSPHTLAVIGAAQFAFLMTFVLLWVARSFGLDYNLLDVSLRAIVSGIAFGFYVYLRSDAPRTRLSHLDRLLADYEPVSKDDYRAFQEKVKAKGAMDDDLVEQWLGLERNALRVAAKSRLLGELSFLKKKI